MVLRYNNYRFIYKNDVDKTLKLPVEDKKQELLEEILALEILTELLKEDTAKDTTFKQEGETCGSCFSP